MWGHKGRVSALIERGDALGRLDAAVARAAAGTGSIALIEGAPGMGKSSLLEAAALQARERGLHVLRASGSEVHRTAPYAVVTDLLKPAVRVLETVVFEGAARLAMPLFQDADPGPGSAGARFHGLFWILSNISERQPTVLIVDDAQWADVASLRFFNYVARQLEDLPVMLMIALRPGEPDLPFEEVARLRSHPKALNIGLAPLSAAGCTSLLRRLGFRKVADGSGEICAQITGGNPLLIESLVEQLDHSRELTPELLTELGESLPSQSLGALKVRGRHLDDAQVRVARSLAVLGSDADVERVSVLTGLPADEVEAAIDFLVGQGLVRLQPSLGFVHPVVRASFYEDLRQNERSSLHASAAKLFLDENESKARVASHLLLTDPQGEPWVYEVLVDAARSASDNGAMELAVRFLERALEESLPDAQRAEIAIAAAIAEAAASGVGARAHLETASKLIGPSPELVRAYYEVGRNLYGNGLFSDAAQVLNDGLEMTGRDGFMGADLDALLVSTARLDIARRREALQRIEEIAREGVLPSGTAGRILRLELALSDISNCHPVEEAREKLRAALPGPDEHLDEIALTTMAPMLVHSLTWCDMLTEAEEVSEKAMTDARASGSLLLWANAGAFGALGMYMQGRIKEAEALGRQALDALPFGWSVAIPFSSTITAYAAMERGDLDAAEEALQQAEGRAWDGTTQWPFFLEARGRWRFLKGDLEGAIEDVSKAGELMVEVIGTNNPALLGWRSRLARLLAAQGKTTEALDLVDEEMTWARRFGAPRALATSLRVAGELRDEIGPIEEAYSLLEDSPALMERAFSCLSLGKALVRKGMLKESRPYLTDALMVAETTGAKFLERDARESLRASGAKPRRPAVTGVVALTPGELRVARFAARGYSNREIAEALFVTMKAVEWHLGNVYRKLGISSRKDLEKALSQGSSPTE